MEILGGILYSLSIFIIYFLVSIEVSQYYSLKRFIKILLDKGRYITIFLLSKLVFFSSIYINELIFLVSEVCIDFILVLLIHPLKYKKTRRNILLFSLSAFLPLCIIYIFYYFDILIYYFPLSILFAFLSNILSFFILSPFEKLLRQYYINKARKKLKNMKDLIVIGVTGSFGKTTLKSYLYDFLSVKYQVCALKENINTLMGVTKMINDNLNENHQILLLELGIDEMNGFDKFKRLVQLDYAFITGIGPMHLATFKNEENVLKAKLKIKNLLKENGKLIVNNDSEKLKNRSEYFFNKDKLKNIKILDNLSLQFDYENDTYITSSFSPFSLPYFDALLIMGKHLFFTKMELKRGIYNIQKVKRRFYLTKINDTILIDDTYNNSSLGLKKSISFLSYLGKRKAIIFTRLIELGKKEEEIYASLEESFKKVFVIFTEKSYLSYLIDTPHIYVQSIEEGVDYALREKFDVVLITSKGESIYLH